MSDSILRPQLVSAIAVSSASNALAERREGSIFRRVGNIRPKQCEGFLDPRELLRYIATISSARFFMRWIRALSTLVRARSKHLLYILCRPLKSPQRFRNPPHPSECEQEFIVFFHPSGGEKFHCDPKIARAADRRWILALMPASKFRRRSGIVPAIREYTASRLS